MALLDDVALTASVAKFILAILAVLFFAYFYLEWQRVKRGLSMMVFYSKWKVVKNSMLVGAGMAALAVGFVAAFSTAAGLVDGVYGVAGDLFEAAGLAVIGFSFYRLMRVELRGGEREEGAAGGVSEKQAVSFAPGPLGAQRRVEAGEIGERLKKIDSELVAGIEKKGKGIKRKKRN